MTERPTRRRGLIGWLAGRSRRFWIVTAALPCLYVASFGPACWLIGYIGIGEAQPDPPLHAADWIGMAYFPLGQIVLHTGQYGPTPVARSLSWYAGLGIPADRPVFIPYRLHHWLVDRDFDTDGA